MIFHFFKWHLILSLSLPSALPVTYMNTGKLLNLFKPYLPHVEIGTVIIISQDYCEDKLVNPWRIACPKVNA